MRPEGEDTGPRKAALSKRGRLLRLAAGVCDPRAWLHMLKIVNYYNYSHVAPLRELRIGPDAAISPDVYFANAHNIEIGARARIGARCHIWAGQESGRIVIGDDCLMAPEVFLTSTSYDFDRGSPVTDQPMTERDIVIGDDVWLGARAVVLMGVRIGNGAVVGAGAVVNRPVPDGAIVAGAPAKVVGRRAPVYPGARKGPGDLSKAI